MKTIVEKLVLVLCTFIFIFGSAELFCRFFVPEELPIRFEQDKAELQQMDLSQLASVLAPDDLLFWRLKPEQHLPENSWPFFGLISNGQGIREDTFISLVKPARELRILFLGDSCTFGYGVRHTETFVALLQRNLNKKKRLSGIKCINAGVPGYSAFQGRRYYETEGYRFAPDLVVACFGWNDGSVWDDMSDFEHDRLRMEMLPPRGLRWSRLCHLVMKRLAVTQSRSRNGSSRPRLNAMEFLETIHQLHTSVRRDGGEFVLLVWPYRANLFAKDPSVRTIYQKAMYEYAITTDCPIIDLIPALQVSAGGARPDDLFFDQGHATPALHERIANKILKSLFDAFPDF